MKTQTRKPENIGVINPYALAEVKLRRKVNWKRVADPRKLLSDTLGMPYEKLFDPKYGSPLYAGPKLNAATHTPMPAVGDGAIVWADPGSFFLDDDAAEVMDPIQGTLRDCYFIAALASVAWARPYVIAQRTRAYAADKTMDMIEFHAAAGALKRIDVTEELPLNSPSNTFIYARSSDVGELWPAIYEKAYAKWQTNDPGDHPDYLPIEFGDPVAAAVELTGLTPYYYTTQALTASEIYNKVKENCFSRKTVNPMVAWTYPSGDDSPDNVNYADANLAANHAYSIMGCQSLATPPLPTWPPSKKAGILHQYIVLRNPWGNYEPVTDPLTGTWIAWDAPGDGGPGFWRTIPMATNDGMFALQIAEFKKYFAGFGVVK